ncbi:hypothetical protein NFI96_006455 [Prochilodus magdalenae]|nr:hypothetical protein NFI96_006455 [Prochilodus magdalenae]
MLQQTKRLGTIPCPNFVGTVWGRPLPVPTCTPVHRANSIRTWMSESGVEELDWPAQSPDLHPIEHLWDELGWRLRARPSHTTSVSDLTNAVLEEWSNIPMSPFLNPVESLPRRVGAVIAAKAVMTSYLTIGFHAEWPEWRLCQTEGLSSTFLDEMKMLVIFVILVGRTEAHMGVVSSVEVTEDCSSSENRRVYCSSDGDDVSYSWTFQHPHHQSDGNQTLLLDSEALGRLTCSAQNHVSRGNKTIELHHCTGLRVFVSVWLFEIIILLSLLVGAFYIYTRIYQKQRAAQNVVSSVEVTYSCSSSEKRRVYCSSDGENVTYSWTFRGTPHTDQPADGNQTLLLDKEFVGDVTCYAQNHVSHEHKTIKLDPCPGTTTKTPTTTVKTTVTQPTQSLHGKSLIVTHS